MRCSQLPNPVRGILLSLDADARQGDAKKLGIAFPYGQLHLNGRSTRQILKKPVLSLLARDL